MASVLIPFVMCVQEMEKREAIAEAAYAPDKTVRLERMKVEVQKTMSESEQKIKASFQAGDLKAAEKETLRLLFLQKSLQEIIREI